jgi:hypothetical protein
MDTPVRPSARSADATGSRPASESKALISQCRELARAKLSGIVADALDKIEIDLFAAAEASTSRAEQQVLFQAMQEAKKHRVEIKAAFDRYFLEIFERRISSRHAAAGGGKGELKVEELTLVDDAAMEEDLVVSDLARKTTNRIDPDQLLGIRARFGHLLSSDAIEDDTANPLSTETVFEALKLACAKLPGDFAVKRSLLNAFQPYVAAGIAHVYADVNQNLISHHVLPRIKHQVKRAADVGVPTSQGMPVNPALVASQAMNLAQLWGGSQGAAAAAAAMSASQALNLGQLLSAGGDLSQVLAGVLNGPPAARRQVTRMLADPSRYAMESALTTPASPALLTSLSALQAATLPTEGGAFDFMAALGDQVRSQSHPLDQLTIELVNMVFDYILDDNEVPQTIKREISRLQIVAVKAAILDRTFFARRNHPLRQLLDRVAEIAADPEVATDESAKFVVGLRGSVDYLVHKFTDDLAVFTAALETIEKIVEEERQSHQKELAPTTVELARKEEAEIAHATALAEIKRRITRKTPAFVREFLYQWWTKTLVDAYMKEREGDDSWTHRLGMVDALVWSVSPLRSSEIQQLASMLPTLMRSLLRGMNAIEVPADARHGFFNQLMQAHTASINTAKAQAKAQQAATPAAESAPAEDAAPVSEPGASDEAPVTAPPADDYFTHTALALERGAVVEFMDAQTLVRSKLSWVSPKQTILLFTSSASGARKLSPKAFAELLRDGKARVCDASEALMDRVVHAMMGPESLPAAA